MHLKHERTKVYTWDADVENPKREYNPLQQNLGTLYGAHFQVYQTNLNHAGVD